MTPDEFDQLMLNVSAHWPQWKANRSTFAAAERLLMDLEYPIALAAVDSLAVTAPDFPPGIGAIRARATELAQPDLLPDADQAWAEVQHNIRAVGIRAVYFDHPLNWSSPAVARVVEAIGWKTLCESEDQMVDRAHFLKLYERVVERERRVAADPPSVAALAASAVKQLPATPVPSAEWDAS